VKALTKALIIIALLAILFYVGRPKLGAFFYNQGIRSYDQKQYKQAIDYFKKSLWVDPGSKEAHFSLGNAYAKAKFPEEAIREYKKAVEIDPAFLMALHALRDAYSDQQKYPDALAILKKARDLNPSDKALTDLYESTAFLYACALLDEATGLYLSADKAQAYTKLKEAINVYPGFGFAHYTLALFYYNDSDYDQARKILSIVMAEDPYFWPAYKLSADIYFENGEYGSASSDYQKAVSLNSNDAGLNNNLGISLMQLERYDEAIPYLQKARTLNPDNIDTQYGLASVLRDSGRLKESAAEYERLVQKKPDYPNVHNDLGDVYRNLGRNADSFREYEQEIRYCREKMKTDPADIRIKNNLAFALGRTGRYAEAERLAKEIIISAPDYRQAYLTLAVIYEEQGRAEEAIAALDKAKGISGQAFIEKDIKRLRSLPGLLPKTITPAEDTVYLKNGRVIRGRIKQQDEEKVIMEVDLGRAFQDMVLYRSTIERIAQGRPE